MSLFFALEDALIQIQCMKIISIHWFLQIPRQQVKCSLFLFLQVLMGISSQHQHSSEVPALRFLRTTLSVCQMKLLREWFVNHLEKLQDLFSKFVCSLLVLQIHSQVSPLFKESLKNCLEDLLSSNSPKAFIYLLSLKQHFLWILIILCHLLLASISHKRLDIFLLQDRGFHL